MNTHYDSIIIGGGFFGMMIAQELKKMGHRRVLIIEKENDLMLRASYINQARVHNGYHYPRNVLTALRSHINFPRFVEDYGDSVRNDFTSCYAIARHGSKVTAQQFTMLCERIGVPLRQLPPALRTTFNPELIEEAFEVQEYAFDAVRLRTLMKERLKAAGVDVQLGTEAVRLRSQQGVAIECRSSAGEKTFHAEHVFVVTYAEINTLLSASGLAALPLKHELTEIALVEPPARFRSFGVTVMCGPFFSCMPFPARGLHSLTHVRYTPHASWQGSETSHDPRTIRKPPSAFRHMAQDISRYMPDFQGCQYRESLWEVKTVLPAHEHDDGRPVLFSHDHGIPGVHCIVGGKIDNIYDALDEVRTYLGARASVAHA